MKTTAALLSCAAILHHVAAQGAYLFTIDRSVMSSSTAMVDSELASAIIARRRSLTDDRYLGIADNLLLQDINSYGGFQQPLFGSQETDLPGKLFIRISGVDMQVNEFNAAMPDLWIQEPAKDLQTDFRFIPKRFKKEGICEYLVPPSLNTPNGHGVEVIFSYPLEKDPLCLSSAEIPTIPLILSLHSFLPSNPSEVKAKLGPLIRILKHFSASDNVESTLLLLPSKFPEPSKSHTHHNKARSAPSSEEEPLDLPSATPASDTPVTANAGKNFTLPSNIPACFTSKASCVNTTNSCSGHGTCYKAYAKCFKCRCGSTVVRENADGTKKTVQWGGAACQKKDISVPFILFAGFGVVMTALIAGVISMMYSMGSQELPSVIGAGVAGPKAGK